MKIKFNVGDYAWGIRQRDRDDWQGPSKMRISSLEPICILGIVGNLCYSFDYKLVFPTHEEAQKVFDKIMEQVKLKQVADAEIRKIIYGPN